MRDVKQLHPDLQKKVQQLITACAKQGITIGIGECVRTVAEQDALYAKGRTTLGNIVTNCKGSSYSSMHQWGVAFDFYLKMDVDGDGQISDDSYNDATGLFGKVGKIGQSIGLEWGGSWKSFKDKPHFQLPNWGSTASKLKKQYGTPDKFMKTWKTGATKVNQNDTVQNVTASKTETEGARAKSNDYKKSYTTTANLNLRSGAGTNKNIVLTIAKGEKVTCYGYYTNVGTSVWLYVAYGKYTGFVCMDYLNPVVEKTTVMYHVQVGTYSVKSNADRMLVKVKAAGFEAFVTCKDGMYKVQVGAYTVKANADAMLDRVRKAGFEGFVTI